MTTLRAKVPSVAGSAVTGRDIDFAEGEGSEEDEEADEEAVDVEEEEGDGLGALPKEEPATCAQVAAGAWLEDLEDLLMLIKA